MLTFVTILIIAVCILLIFIVLIQNPKGGGIASNFAASTQIMGVRKTGDVVEKATWILSIGLLVLCLSTNFMRPTPQDTDFGKSRIDDNLNAIPMPTQPGPEGPGPASPDSNPQTP